MKSDSVIPFCGMHLRSVEGEVNELAENRNTRYNSEFIALIIEISFVKKFLYNLVEKYTIL